MASLNPLTGVLGKRLAAHLLRRATYKFSAARIEAFAALTPTQAVDQLFTFKPLKYPQGPLWTDGLPIYNPNNHSQSKMYTDPAVIAIDTGRYLFGITWRYVEAFDDDTAKWKTIHWLYSLFNIRWDGDTRSYYYWLLLERMARTGNLRSLAQKVTLDNSMLRYLSNSANVKGAANENYAREFMELFTILRGEAVAVGNYTNYTEADISQAARVLTGYSESNTEKDPDTGIIRGAAVISRHDTGDKTFSAAFQNTVIRGATTAADMPRELGDFVDMIFNQVATAKSYIRKMYRFFVGDIITAEIETDIITPLANELKTSGYNHIQILKKLLTSQHFYDRDDSNAADEIIGAKIKSPYELLLQSTNFFQLTKNTANNKQLFYDDFFSYDDHTSSIGMGIVGPPTVEGYPGFYKDSGFSRNWFSNNYMQKRYSFGKTLLSGKSYGSGRVFPYKLDIVKWVKDNIDLPNAPGTPAAPVGASNATRVVEMMMDYLLPERPTGERYDYFMDTLLGGLSPINWYFEWKEYLETNDSEDARVGLERFLKALMSSPEFQTF
jgi:hypothetical protein